MLAFSTDAETLSLPTPTEGAGHEQDSRCPGDWIDVTRLVSDCGILLHLRSQSPPGSTAVVFRNLAAANLNGFRREDCGRPVSLLLEDSALSTLPATNLGSSSVPVTPRVKICDLPRHSSIKLREVIPLSANLGPCQVKTPKGPFFSLRKLKRVVFRIGGKHHSKISKIGCFTDYALMVRSGTMN